MTQHEPSPADLAAARAIYDALRPDDGGPVTPDSAASRLMDTGLRLSDPRLERLQSALRGIAGGAPVDYDLLGPILVGEGRGLLGRALKGALVVPDFPAFCAKLKAIFDEVGTIEEGAVASYIPQLARIDPTRYAMAVCTIDGQQFSIGDDKEQFCVQSTCKPINYAITLEKLGVDHVHAHVGREPSGRSFNEITLNSRGLPHNPLINAGAIMCASMIEPERTPADRFDDVLQTWRRLAGGWPVGFDNAVFLSERDTADRNFALAYFMRENGAFPPGTDLRSALDLYFQCCSITLNARAMAVVAATFANGGVCPGTNERIFAGDTIKNCLSLMASCGMYDFSGEFAFTVGLPAKSGVSGALFIVVPGVCGITVWSPRLDALGNSVRGVAFSERLTQAFPFHAYSDLTPDRAVNDPRRTDTETFVNEAMYLCAAAARGDVPELRRLLARGASVDSADYDGRTPLHLAASEGRIDAVRLLLRRGADPMLADRWGNLPIDDARRGDQQAVIAILSDRPSDAKPTTSAA